MPSVSTHSSSSSRHYTLLVPSLDVLGLPLIVYLSLQVDGLLALGVFTLQTVAGAPPVQIWPAVLQTKDYQQRRFSGCPMPIGPDKFAKSKFRGQISTSWLM